MIMFPLPAMLALCGVSFPAWPSLPVSVSSPSKEQKKQNKKKENIAVANIIEQHIQLHLALCASTVKGSS
jgi:hypothetical protein